MNWLLNRLVNWSNKYGFRTYGGTAIPAAGLREFAAVELRPGAAQRDKTGEFPLEQIGKLQKMGIFGLIVPVEYGGGGVDSSAMPLPWRNWPRQDASVAITLLAHTLCACHINAFGTAEQKERFLAPLARGEKLGAWALTEPGAGSDAGGIIHPAVADDGRLAADRQQVLHHQRLPGRYPGDHGVHRQIAGRKGYIGFYRRRGHPGADQGEEPGQARLPLQRHGGAHAEGRPAAAGGKLLGEFNSGFAQAMEMLAAGRIGVAAMAVGIGRACLEESIAYARKRHAFGRAIAEFQAIQWMLADMATELDAARLSSTGLPGSGTRGNGSPGRRPWPSSTLGGRHAGGGQGGPDPWRLRLHAGLPGGAVSAGGEAVRNRRGDLGDTADGNRPGTAKDGMNYELRDQGSSRA